MKEDNMRRSKSTIEPHWNSITELVDYFESQDMGELWERMPEANFDIDLKRREFLVSIDDELMSELVKVAKSKQTFPIALINSWLKDRLRSKHSKSSDGSLKEKQSLFSTKNASLVFVIYKDRHSTYRWRLCTGSKKIIADSAQGFGTKLDCRREIDLVKKNFREASVIDQTT